MKGEKPWLDYPKSLGDKFLRLAQDKFLRLDQVIWDEQDLSSNPISVTY